MGGDGWPVPIMAREMGAFGMHSVDRGGHGGRSLAGWFYKGDAVVYYIYEGNGNIYKGDAVV